MAEENLETIPAETLDKAERRLTRSVINAASTKTIGPEGFEGLLAEWDQVEDQVNRNIDDKIGNLEYLMWRWGFYTRMTKEYYG